jgi:hypothetical protein
MPILVLAFLAVVIYFVIWSFRENEKLNNIKNYIKNPDAETSIKGWSPARPLVEAPRYYEPKAQIEYATAQMSNFNPTEVWLHKVEELQMLIIYDPKLRTAQFREQRWTIEPIQMHKNYIYIGEF